MLELMWYLFLLLFKGMLYLFILTLILGIIALFIPLKFNIKLQNINETLDTLIFSVSWLFSLIKIVISIDVSGLYGFYIYFLGFKFKKRGILINIEDL